MTSIRGAPGIGDASHSPCSRSAQVVHHPQRQITQTKQETQPSTSKFTQQRNSSSAKSIFTYLTYTPTPYTQTSYLYATAKMSAPQNLAQHVRKEQPQMFLSLAPTTSASYPTAESIKPASHPRRSSSQSSAGTSGSLRFLKLGPVHYGEHPDEHKEDYHEVAVTE
ncbi:hypothetical protein F4781DRAFT_343977 [Annulohypoxylon bovei var. microspora]|nr:hypothetical protein F4781DRAFT_343977 [Annulohypoxylon bovei var. microspora]